jgi:phosphate transport system substrate-binding protein
MYKSRFDSNDVLASLLLEKIENLLYQIFNLTEWRLCFRLTLVLEENAMQKKILIAYDGKDESLIAILEEKFRANLIYSIRKDKIFAQDQPANSNLEEADIILLAISQRFLRSVYFNSTQMQKALERHRRHEASIILIPLQPGNLPASIATLPIIPKNQVPLSSQQDQELASQEIVNFILAMLPTDSLADNSSSTSLHNVSAPSLATQSLSSVPQVVDRTSVFVAFDNFLLSHPIFFLVLVCISSVLVGIILEQWINPLLQGLPGLSDSQWSGWLQVLEGAIAIVLPVLARGLLYLVTKSKRLSYEEISDVGLLNKEKDRGEDDIKLIVNGWEENNARMKIVRLANTGDEPVKKADYEQEPIRFQFDRQSLIRGSIHDIIPKNKIPEDRLKDFIRFDQQNRAFVEVVELPLNPKESVNLKIVTRDKTKEIQVFGGLAGGKITRMKDAQRENLRRKMLINLVAFIICGFTISIVFPLFYNHFNNGCVLGNISIDSSTASTGTITNLVGDYRNTCLLARVAVNSKPSANGLKDLENGNIQLATSEITPQEAGPPYNSYQDLHEHDLAVIPFSLIINNKVTGVKSLSQDQIAKIYDGTYTTWGQVGGKPANLQITTIGRSNDSGTYYAFVNFVLKTRDQNRPMLTLDSTSDVLDHVKAIDGAIGYAELDPANNETRDVTAIKINQQAPTVAQIASGQYPFWAIERFYTQGNPDALTSAFIIYATDNFRTNSTLIGLDAVPKKLLATHQ